MGIRVLLADDQAMVRAGFSALLASEDGLEVCGEVGDGERAVALAHELRPDVVLMDVRMPRMDGIEATRLITTDPALAGTLRVVADGESLLAPRVTKRLIEAFVEQPERSAQPAEGLDELTAREHEILQLVAAGLSNVEIAERLWLSPLTVKTHVSHVLMKMNARDRVQLVVAAYETGLVVPGR